jgi:WD40 repeat protein
VRFRELPTIEPVTMMTLSEDGRFLMMSHQGAESVSVWDVRGERLAAVLESPTPRNLLSRGNQLYVAGHGEGVVSVFEFGESGWRFAEQFEVDHPHIVHLAAAQGEHFDGRILVTCHEGGRTASDEGSHIILLQPDEPRQREVSRATLAEVSFDGRLVMTQGSFKLNPSGGLTAYDFEEFLNGKAEPVFVGGVPRTPYVYQVHPGSYWFGDRVLFGGVPIRRVDEHLAGMVVPDHSQPLCYAMAPVRLAARRLSDSLPPVADRRIEWPAQVDFGKVSHRTNRHWNYLLDHPVAFTHGNDLYLFVLDMSRNVVLHAKTPAVIRRESTAELPIVAASGSADEVFIVPAGGAPRRAFKPPVQRNDPVTPDKPAPVPRVVAAFQPAAANAAEPLPEGLPENLRPFFVVEAMKGRETTRSLRGGTLDIVALAISADGSTIVSCGRNGVCQAIDVKTGEPLGKYQRDEGLEGEQFCIAVSGDGRLAAIGGEFQAVHVWDTRTGEHKFTHDAPDSAVVSVGISDDGKWMIAATENASVYRFPPLGGLGNALVFGPDLPRYDVFGITPDGESAVGTYSAGRSVLYNFPKPGTKSEPPPTPEQVQGPDGPELQKAYILRQWVFPFNHRPGPFTAAGASRNLAAWVGPSDGVTVMSLWRDGLKLSHWESGELGITFVKDIAITPDNERLVAVNSLNVIVVMDLPTKRIVRSLKLSGGIATAAAVSRDGRLVALGYRDAHIALVELVPVPDTPQVVFRKAVLAARDSENYELLEQLAQWLGRDDEPVSWSQGVPGYQQLLNDLLHSPMGWDGPLVDAGAPLRRWFEKHPESDLARLAMTLSLIAEGWSARGSGFAGSVTEEGWRKFGEAIDKAEEVLGEIEVNEETPPEYFRLALILARAQSGVGRERFDELTAQLMKFAPRYVPAHDQAVEYLLPRWHGEPGDIADYVERVSDQVGDEIGGEAGDILYGQITMEAARFGLHGVDFREFFLAHGLDLDRARRGLELLRKARPADPTLLRDLIYSAWLAEDRPAALRLLKEFSALKNPPPDLWNKPVSVSAIRLWAQSL